MRNDLSFVFFSFNSIFFSNFDIDSLKNEVETDVKL